MIASTSPTSSNGPAVASWRVLVAILASILLIAALTYVAKRMSPSSSPAAPLEAALELEQRTFVYLVDANGSVAAESALGRLLADGWRINQAVPLSGSPAMALLVLERMRHPSLRHLQ